MKPASNCDEVAKLALSQTPEREFGLCDGLVLLAAAAFALSVMFICFIVAPHREKHLDPANVSMSHDA